MAKNGKHRLAMLTIFRIRRTDVNIEINLEINVGIATDLFNIVDVRKSS